MQHPARLYTGFAGIFLLLQGASTLGFRLYPPLDQAFPALLAITQMAPPHSILHIVTGLVALAVLFRGGKRGAFWFAAGFGMLYIGLSLTGMVFGQPSGLAMQPFDHPFHVLLGGLGIAAAIADRYRNRKEASL